MDPECSVCLQQFKKRTSSMCVYNIDVGKELEKRYMPKKAKDELKSSSDWKEFQSKHAVNLMRPEKKSSKLKNPLCGDLKKLGWVVYEGVNLHTLEHLPLQHNILDLYKERSVKLKKLDDNTERCVFPVHEKIDHFPAIGYAFQEAQKLVQKHILTKEMGCHVEFSKPSILANVGCVEEQLAHRDYGMYPQLDGHEI